MASAQENNRRRPKNNSTEEKLLYACRYGIVDEVKSILKRPKGGNTVVNLEYEGVVVFEGERDVEGATPLWSAATAGHIEIVRSLLRAGVDVNHSTKSKSTPLRGACYDGHIDVVRELLEAGAQSNIGNRLNQTPLMIASGRGHKPVVELLLQWKVDTNIASVTGDTALHAAAEKGCLDIVKLLLEHGARADLLTKEGWTPAILAAASRYEEVVSYLIELPACTPEEHANALELLGAVWVDMDGDLEKAEIFWRRALQYRETAGVPKTNVLPNTEVYWNKIEVCTMSGLDEVLQDMDSVLTNSLLVRERVLGPKHPQTPHYLRIRGDECLQLGDFRHTMLLWERAIEMDEHADIDALDLNSAATIAQNIIICLTGLTRMKEQGHQPTVKAFFYWALNCIRSAMKSGASVRELVLVLMIALGLWLKWEPLSEEEAKIKSQAVRDVVELGAIGRDGLLPLNCCCTNELAVSLPRLPADRLTALHTFPSEILVRELVSHGARVNAQDKDGNTALHAVCQSAMTEQPTECHTRVAKFLLEAKTHIDIRNASDVPALPWLDRSSCNAARVASIPELAILQVTQKVLKLECLAARSIVVCKLDASGSLPSRLQRFVELHAPFVNCQPTS